MSARRSESSPSPAPSTTSTPPARSASPGAEAVPLWHGDADLRGVDAVVVPGGFSYGDYLRVRRDRPVRPRDGRGHRRAAGKGMPVLGICNGFQILCEAGLLPGALIRNDGLHFVCRDQWLRVENTTTAWTTRYARAPRSSSRSSTARAATWPTPRRSTSWRARGAWCSATSTATPTAPGATSPGSAAPTAGSSGSCRTPSTPSTPLTGPSDDGSACSYSALDALKPAGHVRLGKPAVSLDSWQHLTWTLPPSTPPHTPSGRRTSPSRTAELGLADDEYARIREILGRRPTDAELAMYSVMWSEHCSYKSSKVHLALLRRDHHRGDARQDARRYRRERGRGRHRGRLGRHVQGRSPQPPVLCGALPGRGDRVSAASSATSSRWARGRSRWPTRCGSAPPTRPTPRRVLPGVVAGIGGYGNCLGAAEHRRRGRVRRVATRGTRWSTPVRGRDAGRRTCTWRTPPAPATRSSCSARAPASTASAVCPCWPATRSRATRRRRAEEAAQRAGGRPVHREGADRVLASSCSRRKLVVGIQDLGGAGLACATSELAAAGDGGMHIDLDRVPLRGRGDDARPRSCPASRRSACARSSTRPTWTRSWRCAAKWDVIATVIGEVTDGDRLVITGTGRPSSTCRRAPWRTRARSTTARYATAGGAGRHPGRHAGCAASSVHS